MGPKSRLELLHNLSSAPERVSPINLPAVELLLRRGRDLLKDRCRFGLLGFYFGSGFPIPEVVFDRLWNRS